jgi:putative transposase
MLELGKSSYYYIKKREKRREEGRRRYEEAKDKINGIYTKRPYYGRRRMKEELKAEGIILNHKTISKIMKKEGLRALYPKKRLSDNHTKETRCEYLLKELKIERANQVWGVDITYVKCEKGYMYLAAIIDCYTREIKGYSISNVIDTKLCIEALKVATSRGEKPEILNSDKGSQFTSEKFKEELRKRGIKQSMTGVGRAKDNGKIERFFRSYKYEAYHLSESKNTKELIMQIEEYMLYYNQQRKHQALGYKTPSEAGKLSLPEYKVQ